MKKIKIIKSRPIKEEEEVIDQQDQDVAPQQPEITYESNPLEFMLMKYPTLTKTLTDLLTENFRDYITGVYIMAPKPTIFKIVLHNNRSFHLIFMGNDKYEAKVSGKKYWLSSVGEFENAVMSIADLLMLGTPPTTQGPETETASTPEETPAETPEETPEETPAEEEGGEELAESKKNLGIKLVKELTIDPEYSTKKGPNPYYTVTPEVNEKVKSALKLSGELVYKSVPKKEKVSYSDPKGPYSFEVMILNKDNKLTSTKKYVNLATKSVKGHYGEKSSGSGGGAEKTALQESAQCLVNAIRYTLREDITSEDLLVAIKPKNIKKYSSKIETTSSLNDIVNFLNNNPDWQDTACLTANLLASNYKGDFKFYRGEGIVLKINEAAKEALKKEDIKANINKWNPADIWMATEKANDINFPTDLDKLNALIKELYDKQILIGVSLKKCSQCHVDVYNASKETKPAFKFIKIESKDKDVFKTKDLYIEFSNGGEIQFRNFDSIDGWQGEVKGSEAAAGKVGKGVIDGILKKLGKEPLPKQAPILDDARKLTPNFVSEFFKVYNKTSLSPKMNSNEFNKAIKAADLGSRTSNYVNVHLVSRLDSMSKNEKDLFVSQIIGYAKSSSEFSSVFAKVS